MDLLTYEDLDFDWKDEALEKHGDLNEKIIFYLKNRIKIKNQKQIIKECVGVLLSSTYIQKSANLKEKRVKILNGLATKLYYKEIVDYAIKYINETVKY